MRIMTQILLAFAILTISKSISDTHFSGSLAGILVMAVNRLVDAAMAE